MKYSKNEEYFKAINTEDKAYFLGLLFADGTVRPNGTITISLQESDREILEKFLICLDSNHRLYFLNNNSKNSNWSNQYILSITSKSMMEDLAIFGCIPNKTQTILFPSKGLIPNNLVHHFIRGYFDGDGSIWDGKRTKMIVKDHTKKELYRQRIIHNVKFNITGNYNFITSLQNLLIETLGFNKTKLNIRKSKESSVTLEYSGRKQIRKFYNFIYKDATVFMKRKKEKFEEIINCALIK